ncbi:GntR family transcriptional regulator [Mesorhizobium sp. ANAO-SY3R2]|uniref:GntR family transcriptional regulator n=1 Tax=Mesorhizobium sp. ANAO-SY3R2 TaxID=3166644 RepID=UPI00366B7560
MKIKPLATDNLSTQAYGALRGALIDGDFAPGDRLVLHDIAQKLGTSVTPVREACLRLVSEQGLEIRSGRFLTVPELNLGRYLEIRKMRIALEGLATAEGAAKATSKDVDRLAECQARFVKASLAQDNFTAIRLNREFHFGVYRLCGMKMLLGQIENLWVSMGPILKVYYEEADDHYLEAEEHVSIMAALRDHDADAARDALVRDIVRGGEGLLAYLGGRATN